MKDQVVTSIVHHDIKEDMMDKFVSWHGTVKEASQKFDGFVDSKIIGSLGRENEVISIFRFKNQRLLDQWLVSKARLDLLAELDLISDNVTAVNSYTGLEYWFDRKAPGNVTMMIITFAGLLPLVLIVPPIIAMVTGFDGVILNTVSTALIVVMMTYIVMPLLMRLMNSIEESQ